MPSPADYCADLGLQLYTVREQLTREPRATLEAIAGLGYAQVESLDTEMLPLIKPICNDLGLGLRSTFYNWTAVTGNQAMLDALMPGMAPKQSFEEMIDAAAEAGISEMIFGYLLPPERSSIEDYKLRCEQINRAGEQIRAAGMRQVYHHHNFEFDPIGPEGERGWDVLLAELDAGLTDFELDVFWLAIAGQNPVDMIKSLKGRVRLLHLKDMAAATPIGFDNMQVDPAAFRSVGSGSLDFRAILEAAVSVEVKACIVEQDWSDDPMMSIRESFMYLREITK